MMRIFQYAVQITVQSEGHATSQLVNIDHSDAISMLDLNTLLISWGDYSAPKQQAARHKNQLENLNRPALQWAKTYNPNHR
jgi:hypothetical protein